MRQQCTCRHRFKHLCRDNDRLSGDVALRNHHLLSKEHLTGRNLDTKITTSDHDTVSCLEDLVKVGDTLLVLDLDDDLDVGTVWAKDVTDVMDILGTTNEGREDHVHTVLDTEAEIVLVLFRESGEIHVGLGEVDTLARGDVARVQGANVNALAVDREDEKGEDTVVDIDQLAGGGNFGEVGL